MMHIETEYNEPNSHKLNATALQLNKPVRKEWGLPPAWLIMDITFQQTSNNFTTPSFLFPWQAFWCLHPTLPNLV